MLHPTRTEDSPAAPAARPIPARRAGLPIDLELLGVAAAAAAWYGAFYLGRGLDVPDEGLLLHVAERLAAGQVPYRDVYFIYTPGLQYTLALLFRLFGVGLTVEHALQGGLAVAMAITVYGLVWSLARWRPLAVVTSLIVILGGLNSCRFLLGLLTVALLGRFAVRPSPWRLLAVGLAIGITYLFAQEVGLYALGTAVGYLGLAWLCRPARRQHLPVLLQRLGVLAGGIAGIVGPWLAIMAQQGALGAMVEATLRVAFLHQPQYMHVPLPPLLPLLPAELDTNVVYGPPGYLLYVKALLYLPLVSVGLAIAVFLGRWGRNGWTSELGRVAPLVGFATLSLATVADRADYYHLRQLLPVTLVLVAWLLSQARAGLLATIAAQSRQTGRSAHPRRRTSFLPLAVLLPLAAVVIMTAGEAKQWRQDQDIPLVTVRGSVRVGEEQAHDLGALLATLRQHTRPGEPIFVWPAETAIYFLADRPNPTRFGQLVPTEAALLADADGAVQREMLADIAAANVRWAVVAPTDNVNGMSFAAYAPLLAAALDAQFAPVERFGYWTLRVRR